MAFQTISPKAAKVAREKISGFIMYLFLALFAPWREINEN
jgi:hypothetical protein